MSDKESASGKRDVEQIAAAYKRVEAELRHVGKLLRTTYAGKFMWSNEHKSAVLGLRVIVEKLRYDLPQYND